MRTIRVHRTIPSLALALSLLATVVGCDSDGPSSPRVAALGARGALTFNCGVNCSYEGEAFNAGNGCAANVRGITRLLRPDGSELASDEWQLDPARRVNVGEAFLYDGCCFSLGDVGNMGSYRTDLSWDTVPCS
ncbi:MAG: hypothetical protein NDJ75_05015 [Thermoanaerobaculia bacterium]|nr:hypothetical protein [Thermoanaerobaculia bacterium]